tara:strand:- start:3566 stop:3922 length:357 start_codon:yes stop_codon:yes gene_type:complete
MNKVKFSKYILNKNSSIQDALNKFRTNRCRAALIAEKNKVIGSISEGDIIRALIIGISLHAPITKYMNTNFKFLKEKKKLEINKLILKYNISLIPICDKKLFLKDIVVVNQYLKKNLN